MDTIFDNLFQDLPAVPVLAPTPEDEARESTLSRCGEQNNFPVVSEEPNEKPPTPGSESGSGENPSIVETSETGEPSTGPSVPHSTLSDTLDRIVTYLEHYVNFATPSQSIGCALWAAHTWIYDKFRYTPYLHIFSPEKRCGKSVLLDALALIVARPWKVDNLSEASLFHKADQDKSTMLWDEVDNVFKDAKENGAIIGLLNSGFKRGGRAARVPKGVFTEYDVYCPKALCGIGRIPDTTHDRCIDIRLARAKTKNVFREEVAEEEAAAIREALKKFAGAVTLEEVRIPVVFPAVYATTDGRRCDITEPLLILSMLAGGEWPEKAMESLGDLCGNIDDLSTGIQLLKDVRASFLNRRVDRITTETLLNDLIQVEDANSPWPVWWENDIRRGAIRGPAKKLATLLEGYGIKPHLIRIGNESARGYVQHSFKDAFSRYLPEPGKMDTAELDLEL